MDIDGKAGSTGADSGQVGALRKVARPSEAPKSQTPHCERMSRLAESFHSLEDKPGVRPWEAGKFYKHLRGNPAYTGPSRLCGLFVLNVWNSGYDWHVLENTGFTSKPEKVRFNVVAALGRWDARNRAAFLAWAMNPWWA